MGSSSSSPSPKSLPSISSSPSSSRSQSLPSTPQQQQQLQSSTNSSPQQQLQPSPTAPLIQPQQLQTSLITPLTQQQQPFRSSPESVSIGQLNEKQLANYDLPNQEDIKKQYDKPTIKYLFNQFVFNYYNFYSKRADQNKAIVDLNNERKNISILVIVGSSIEYIRSIYFEGTYQKNSEDFSSALFIRHIFHNAFGIPYKQILITSTQNSDFYVNNRNVDLISKPNSIFDECIDIDPIKEKIDFKFA